MTYRLSVKCSPHA